MEPRELIKLAKGARENAYVPYSNFAVGAAVLTKKGNIYTGCNVENASYGLTTCAERTAIVKAVSQGERELEAIAVVADTPGPCSPCGACRQIIGEFGENIKVIMGNLKGDLEVKESGELLPGRFGLGT